MESERANGDVSSDNPRKKEEEITNEYIQNEILETYDIFSKVYESSDNLSFVDSEEDISSKNLGFHKNTNLLRKTLQQKFYLLKNFTNVLFIYISVQLF